MVAPDEADDEPDHQPDDGSDETGGREPRGDKSRIAAGAEALRDGVEAFARSAGAAVEQTPDFADALRNLTDAVNATAEEAARHARDLDDEL